ncbi:MAG: lysozyme inhibitor LprI family protein [Ruegeria sp.]|uniref:lysozyme inhibitor LprI family protein n=1 Tax=Ruegeria sp. TaxID=1879320 RepID=UPI00349EB6E2
MRAALALALAASVAWPALAADPEFDRKRAQFERDISAIRDCMQTDAFIKAGSTCAEITVQDCRDRLIEPYSRLDMEQCLVAEMRIWDQLYSETVSGVVDAAIAFDADSIRFESAAHDRLELFLRTEAAWLTYAQEQCFLESAHRGAGTAASSTQYVCRIRLRAERVSDLRNLGLVK